MAKPADGMYKIEKGDTIPKIAKKFGVQSERHHGPNPTLEMDKIAPGKRSGFHSQYYSETRKGTAPKGSVPFLLVSPGTVFRARCSGLLGLRSLAMSSALILTTDH